MTKKYLWFPLVLALLLGGCGFHLRGSVNLSPRVSALYLDGGEAELRKALGNILDFSGATLQNTAKSARAILKISENSFSQRVRSVDTRGKATGYYLDYQATMELANAVDGKVMLPASRLSMTRDYDYSSTNVLQSENEVLFLKTTMRKEMASRIARRLASVH